MSASATFSAERMLAEAQARTGLSDWGGELFCEATFRALFDVLCPALENEAGLTPRGRTGARLRLEAMLDARLCLVEDRKQRPGIADERIVRPLFVLGLPRTGSSFLLALLAQDPANASTSIVELMFPSPMPGETNGGAGRRARVEAMNRAMGMLDPEVQALHPWGDPQPEECIYACEVLAWSEHWPTSWNIPSYNRARRKAVPDAFRTHRLVLQTLQHGNNKQRFALKSPGHLFRLHELLAMYPDATIVQTHRDPAKVIPSMTALVGALRRAATDEPLALERIAATNLKAFATLLNQVIEFRASAGLEAQFFDAHFSDIVSDPLGTIGSIYDHFGLALSAEALAAMQKWLDDPANNTPRGRHSLAQYGLQEADIDSNFNHYIEHYGIKRERNA